MTQLIKVAESLLKCVMAMVIRIEVGVGARVHSLTCVLVG